MKTRTIDEIADAFRDMGLNEGTWGRTTVPDLQAEAPVSPQEQLFIRIETTTKPLGGETNADLA